MSVASKKLKNHHCESKDLASQFYNWLKPLVNMRQWGRKSFGGNPYHTNTKDSWARHQNGQTMQSVDGQSYHTLKYLPVKDLREHVDGRETLYFTGAAGGNLALVYDDLDAHDAQTDVARAMEIHCRLMPGLVYFASDRGASGYFILDKTGCFCSHVNHVYSVYEAALQCLHLKLGIQTLPEIKGHLAFWKRHREVYAPDDRFCGKLAKIPKVRTIGDLDRLKTAPVVPVRHLYNLAHAVLDELGLSVEDALAFHQKLVGDLIVRGQRKTELQTEAEITAEVEVYWQMQRQEREQRQQRKVLAPVPPEQPQKPPLPDFSLDELLCPADWTPTKLKRSMGDHAQGKEVSAEECEVVLSVAGSEGTQCVAGVVPATNALADKPLEALPDSPVQKGLTSTKRESKRVRFKPGQVFDPDSFRRQDRVVKAVLRQTDGQATVENCLEVIKDSKQFTGEWRENESKRGRRVESLLNYSLKTFDAKKCKRKAITFDPLEFLPWVEKRFPSTLIYLKEVQGRDLDLDGCNTTILEVKVKREALAIDMAIRRHILVDDPCSDPDAIPHDRVRKRWRELYSKGLISIPWTNLRGEATRELLDQHEIIKITDRNYYSRKCMRYKLGTAFPGLQTYPPRPSPSRKPKKAKKSGSLSEGFWESWKRRPPRPGEVQPPPQQRLVAGGRRLWHLVEALVACLGLEKENKEEEKNHNPLGTIVHQQDMSERPIRTARGPPGSGFAKHQSPNHVFHALLRRGCAHQENSKDLTKPQLQLLVDLLAN